MTDKDTSTQSQRLSMLDLHLTTLRHLRDQKQEINNIVKGCHVLIETDTVLGDRIELLNEKLSAIDTRLDIVNKRLRRLEDAIGRLAK